MVGGNFAALMGIAALLGLDGFGRLSFLWALAMIGGTLLSLGLPLYLLRELSKSGTEARPISPRSLAFLTLALPGALAALLALIYGLLSPLLPPLPALALLAAGFTLHLTGCAACILRACGSMHASMVLRDAAPTLVLFLAALTATAADRAEPTTILTTFCILNTALCAILLRALFKRLSAARLIAPKGRSLPLTLTFWGSSLAGTGYAQVDLLLGGLILGAGDLGLYALVRRCANLVALPVSVATWVIAPRTAQAHESGDAAALARLSAEGNQIALIPGTVIALTLLCAAPWAAPQGGLTLAILCAGMLAGSATASAMTLATLCGREGATLTARLIGIAGFAGCAVCLAALPGGATPTGHAAALSLSMLASQTWLWLTLRRGLGVDTLLWPRAPMAQGA
ncbi:oligosaccharide flippase family protein [Alphaproteobacteria bacterium KMM 3653]|uniref:Oligosaccharide flippase family protein n=1 Tax=Harenicola maris TaxID=2841044 RepID=A0AAP2CQ55_9RHOB|nr:oligosaccharide flippase family protein [Harenicola maris]